MSFDNVEYWKKRMVDQLNLNWNSYTNQTLEKIKKDTIHVELEAKEIATAMNKITRGFVELRFAIANAKVKKEKSEDGNKTVSVRGKSVEDSAKAQKV